VALAQSAGEQGVSASLLDFSDGAATSLVLSGTWWDGPCVGDPVSPEDVFVSVAGLRAKRGATVDQPLFVLAPARVGRPSAAPGAPSKLLGWASAHAEVCVMDVGRLDESNPLWRMALADCRAGGWLVVETRWDNHGLFMLQSLLHLVAAEQVPPSRVVVIVGRAFCDVAALDETVFGPVRWGGSVSEDPGIAQMATEARLPPGETGLMAPVESILRWSAGLFPDLDANARKPKRRWRA
jgi:hypothetical protein